MYGVRTDLFGDLLGTSGDVVRQLLVWWWRRAGLAATGRGRAAGPAPLDGG
ncbi:MAG TPA: hypothetical protein VKD26_08680 [Streptosporangiaceae bacterium]|nr:hypothetical protein [Streptosporangiaceae bacterium]